MLGCFRTDDSPGMTSPMVRYGSICIATTIGCYHSMRMTIESIKMIQNVLEWHRMTIESNNWSCRWIHYDPLTSCVPLHLPTSVKPFVDQGLPLPPKQDDRHDPVFWDQSDLPTWLWPSMAYIFGEPKTIRNGIPRIDLDILTGVFHFGYLDIHIKNALLMPQKSYKNPILFSRSIRGQNNPHKFLASSQVAWPVQAQMSFDRFSLLIEANAGDNVECRWLVVLRFLAYLHRFTSYYIHVYIYIYMCVCTCYEKR